MTPEQEALIRHMFRYAACDEGRKDREFIRLAVDNAPWILSNDKNVDAICKSEREQVNLDEMERRFEQC